MACYGTSRKAIPWIWMYRITWQLHTDGHGKFSGKEWKGFLQHSY